MDAVVIVDPVQYQRRRDDRDDVSMPLRSLHFGPDGAGRAVDAQLRRGRQACGPPAGPSVELSLL
jgi:hypothetical protein